MAVEKEVVVWERGRSGLRSWVILRKSAAPTALEFILHRYPSPSGLGWRLATGPTGLGSGSVLFCGSLAGTHEASALPALKRLIRVEILSRSA